MSDLSKLATRRTFRRDPIVTKYHVEDRPPSGKIEDGDRTRDREFLSEGKAVAWSMARMQARQHVAKTEPDLSEPRAEKLAFKIAEALYSCAEIMAKVDADAPEKTERSVRDAASKSDGNSAPPVPDSGGHMNGAGAHHG